MGSKVVKIGTLEVGGKNPVRIKGMLKTPSHQERNLIKEARALEAAGAEALRVAFKEKRDVRLAGLLKEKVGVPLVADIHFNPQLALLAIDSGFDGIRLNPLNITKKRFVREIARAALKAHLSIRIGVNSGGFRKQFRTPCLLAKEMVNIAANYIKLFEDEHFFDIIVSLKTSHVNTTILANSLFARQFSYPVHLGVTATGPFLEGVVKSSLGLGVLLSQGIGNIIRVSLTAPAKKEIYAAQAILQFLGIRDFFTEIISCPACGRCQVNLEKIVRQFKKALEKEKGKKLPKTIAIMGCIVNGPGESSQADIGVAFGKNRGAFFKKGKVIGYTTQKSAVKDLLKKAEDVIQ